ncbi:hypothetical protein LINGRAHAP2_LOCUS10920 [Linum grandiflorum]
MASHLEHTMLMCLIMQWQLGLPMIT